MNLVEIYTKYHKHMLIVPAIIILISLFTMFSQYQKTGDVMIKDVSLQGGITATVYSEKQIDIHDVEVSLSKEFSDVDVKRLSEFGSDKQLGVIIEVSEMDEEKLKSILEKSFGVQLTDENFSVESVGSSLGSSFYRQMIKAMVLSFIFIGIVVFIAFRALIPSLATIAAGLFNILSTISFTILIGQRVSAVGIAAILMLIGYSIDTDILQTTRIMKRNTLSPSEAIVGSMKTGLTMTLTSLAAGLLGYILATSQVFKEMFLIISFGLIMDMILTYLMNAPLLIMYANKKANQNV